MRGNAAARRAARTPLHGRHTQCAGPRAAKGRTGRSRRVPTSHAGNKGAKGKRCPEGLQDRRPATERAAVGGPRRHRLRNARVTSRSHGFSPAHAPLRPTCAGARPNRQRGRFSAWLQARRRLSRKRRLLLLLHEGWKPAGPRRRSAGKRAGGSACDSPAVCPQTACPQGRAPHDSAECAFRYAGMHPATPA